MDVFFKGFSAFNLIYISTFSSPFPPAGNGATQGNVVGCKLKLSLCFAYILKFDVHLLGGSTDAVHSGLARQVSSLLTNHLARATECSGNQAAGNDALQDVLSLLNDLSR